MHSQSAWSGAAVFLSGGEDGMVRRTDIRVPTERSSRGSSQSSLVGEES